MFVDTITLFNFHEQTGKWYPTVIKGVDLQVDTASKLSTPGTTDGADIATVLIQSKKDKSLTFADGSTKTYLGPKAYAACADPEAHFTFKLEKDFFWEGAYESVEPIVDDDYDSGFYHEFNKANDGVYAVKSAAFLSLIPHFEIGGR